VSPSARAAPAPTGSRSRLPSAPQRGPCRGIPPASTAAVPHVHQHRNARLDQSDDDLLELRALVAEGVQGRHGDGLRSGRPPVAGRRRWAHQVLRRRPMAAATDGGFYARFAPGERYEGSRRHPATSCRSPAGRTSRFRPSPRLIGLTLGTRRRPQVPGAGETSIRRCHNVPRVQLCQVVGQPSRLACWQRESGMLPWRIDALRAPATPNTWGTCPSRRPTPGPTTMDPWSISFAATWSPIEPYGTRRSESRIPGPSERGKLRGTPPRPQAWRRPRLRGAYAPSHSRSAAPTSSKTG
jgi:hypothetical protein